MVELEVILNMFFQVRNCGMAFILKSVLTLSKHRCNVELSCDKSSII